MKTIHKIILLTALLSLPLLGCGVKPNSLEPPKDAENKEFPKQYPTQ